MLDSQGFVRAGWVHDLRLHKFSTSQGTKYVVKGKVNIAMHSSCAVDCILCILQIKHSQRMAETPLLPWVVLEQEGGILAAHCTCMAGYEGL